MNRVAHWEGNAVFDEPITNAAMVVFVHESHRIGLHPVHKIGGNDIVEFVFFGVHSNRERAVVPVLLFLQINLRAFVVVEFHCLGSNGEVCRNLPCVSFSQRSQ